MIAVVAMAVALAPSAAAGREHASCATRGKTVLASRKARVFRAHYDPGYDAETYACLYRRGGAKRLTYDYLAGGSASGYGAAFQLTGHFVAFAQVNCGVDDCSYTPKTVDLRTRRAVRQLGQRSDLVAPFTMRVAKSGSLAILARDEPQVGQSDLTVYEVRAVEATGTTTLDSGPGVDPASLALAGSHVYWTRDGVPHSATIQ